MKKFTTIIAIVIDFYADDVSEKIYFWWPFYAHLTAKTPQPIGRAKFDLNIYSL